MMFTQQMGDTHDTPMEQEHMLCVLDIWDAMDNALVIIPITSLVKQGLLLPLALWV